MNDLEADYVIVGAGSAGCVLANRLSADPSIRVVLLEAGGRDINPWIHVPVGYFKTMHNPKVDWCYATESEPALNGRRLDWPRGKVLGGSSSLNGLLYVRGQRQDYDRWRQMGNRGWGWDDVLPLFKRTENQERGADAYHGTGGPLTVANMRLRRPICDAWVAAARNAGYPFNPDYNGAEQEGVGYFQLTARRGRRCSAAVAYLHPVKNRSNLKVVTRAHTTRVLFEGNRAVGVAYLARDGCQRVARARGEVILSSGAIGTPQLLMLSGIGDTDHLKTRPGIETPDIQFHIQPWSADSPGEGVHPFSAFTMSVCQLRPESRGEIRLKDGRARTYPAIRPNYLATETDRRTLVEGVKIARRISTHAPLAGKIAGEYRPGAAVTGDADVLEWIRATATTIYHPTGTCKMGADALAVVDARLKVHNVQSLRVADCAIMPEIVSGNTNAAAIMIGEKASDMILEDRRA